MFLGAGREAWRGDGRKNDSAQDPSQVESPYWGWGYFPVGASWDDNSPSSLRRKCTPDGGRAPSEIVTVARDG